jgi:tRNA(Ile)-lysidine synthase
VSKLLRDLKIPKHLRDEIPVLVGDNQILWVLGLRRSNYAPVTSKTKQIQQLIFEGGWQRIITHPETR